LPAFLCFYNSIKNKQHLLYEIYSQIYRIIFSFLIFFFSCSWSQSVIKGKVIDDTDNTPVENAIVLFYNEIDNKIIEHVYSKKDGSFSLLKTYSEGIYRIEISKLGYQKSVQQIIIGAGSDQTIEVNLSLKQTAFQLKEINIESPIIVKKDTIIYDIEYFMSKHDQSLEEVLLKIEGFEINSMGDITVNGEPIKKVLVDGKEISGFGAGVITKAISPEKVKSVEVRFDEKDKKIKESLLDKDKYAVLDIKLKDEYKKTFFVKQNIAVGYRNNTKVGGLTDLFRIGPKLNIQTFIESNNFGKNRIKLAYIRNIGSENFGAIFKPIVDLNDLRTRHGYYSQRYGFDNFTDNHKSIIGTSVNVPLTEKTDIYFGSFSNYDFIRKKFFRQLYFEQTILNDYSENNFISEYNSKNKLQLKHTSDKVKLRSDVNYVFFDQRLQNFILDSSNQNDFLKKHYLNNFYLNNKLEYIISPKIGFTSELSYSNEKFDVNTSLLTTNTLINTYLGVSEAFDQQNKNTQTQLNKIFKFSYQSDSFGIHFLGYKYHNNELENQKTSNSLLFNADKGKYSSSSNSVIYNFFWAPRGFRITSELEYAFIRFPVAENFVYYKKEKPYFQCMFNVQYNFPNNKHVLLSNITHKVEPFPLHKTTLGNVLTDFHSVFITSQHIEPYYNTTYKLLFSNEKKKKVKYFVIYSGATSKNVNNQRYNNGIILTESNQLSSNINMLSLELKQNFLDNFYIKISGDNEISSSEFLYSGNIENAKSYSFSGGIKASYTPNKIIYFNLYPRYSHFIFSNSTNNTNTTFDFITNHVSLKSFFLEEKLTIGTSYKQVNFLKSSKSDFNNFDIEAVYKTEKYRYFVMLNNIFNSKNFITQDLNNNFLNVSNNHVFARYINFGFEFKID